MSGPSIDRANSSGDIWTPWPFVYAAENKFGKFDWDLAATAASAKAGLFIELSTDSLTVPWHALPVNQSVAGKAQPLLFLNPPYSIITPWARKCVEERNKGAEILLLVPGSIGANWYWDYVEGWAQVYSVGRMVFDNCYNKRGELVTTPYPKDLILVHYVPDKLGDRMQRWRWEDE